MTSRRRTFLVLAALVLAPLAIQQLHRSIQILATDAPTLSMLKDSRAPKSFAFVDQSGGQLTLAKFRGQNILLNVWATWCPPCRDELPSLDRLEAILGTDTNIRVIALSVDNVSLEQLQAFYKAHAIKNLKIFRGDQGPVMDALSVRGLPTTLLLNSDGLEIARLVGPTKWDDPDVVSSVLQAVGAVTS